MLLARGRMGWLVFSGTCFGLAAFIRVFYLYPVLIMASLYFLLWLRHRNWRELGFAVLFIPILFQVYGTWKEEGVFSYLAPDESDYWKSAHFSSRATGYDTVLPFDAYQWFSECAVDYGGLQGAWQQRAWHGLGCILWNRYRFYFGSYSPYTYLVPRPYFEGDGNILLFREQLEQRPIWLFDRVQVMPDVAMAPDGLLTAEKIQVPAGYDEGFLMQGFEPRHPVAHVFSAWLWADDPLVVILSLVRESDGLEIASQQFSLDRVPRRLSVTGVIPDKSIHLVRIGAPQDPVFTDGGDVVYPERHFYAWGAQLERSDVPLVYHPDVRIDHQRHWMTPLLWVNGLFMVFVICLLFRLRKHMAGTDWVVALFPMLIFGQSMLVVPEQRFIAVLLVMMWMLVFAAVLFLYRKCLLRVWKVLGRKELY
ncbi:MAG: hypothetical protein EP312_10540 [Gammaproteobacteria bacterium]|nr:MAG: hypothetical protein EP312_10540 [Gammaproteobacteria bacterium]